MAAVKGVNVTKYDAGPSGDNAIDKGLANGQIDVWSDTYEASALAAASTIDLAEIPADSTIHYGVLSYDALGSGTTIKIGDSNDDDRYLGAIDTSSAGATAFNLVDGLQYRIGTNTGDSRIIGTTAGTCTGTVKLTVFFSR